MIFIYAKYTSKDCKFDFDFIKNTYYTLNNLCFKIVQCNLYQLS